MANRLAGETSPYLLQHKDNPVDWWPWGPEAFEEARRRGVPVLLSVGYAACHWCHVMAHESFEDPGIAALMNDNFVNVKVDREERPDVDAVYMEAVQAMTGHGGWPMTAFLTPNGEPFFCGTYFPPADRHGMPGFPRLLKSIAAAWRERRGEIEATGADIVRRLADRGVPQGGGRVDALTLDRAAESLSEAYDDAHGGFGGAPKFPPSMCLEFLLRHHARTGSKRSLELVAGTCERMARGGLYDQLGGGFARYSVDGQWVVPHFEKMLYDNALLLRVYLHWWRATGDPLARRVVEETAGFLLRDLRTPEGGFASALDADSEGEEGRYYVWTPEQIGDPEAAAAYGVTASGTFEHGTSVLQRFAEPPPGTRERLLEIRGRRVPPARDDKVVAAWNGLAIAALAEAGALLGEPAWVGAARAAAELLERLHLSGGRLLRTSRNGEAGRNAGVLEDYGDVAEGLLALYSATGDARWYDRAGELLDVVLDRFGGWYDTADDAETLVSRPKDPTDGATPAGSSAAAGALLSYAALSGSERHRTAAEDALAQAAPLFARHARFTGWSCAVAEAVLAGPAEVAVVAPPGDGAVHMLTAARLGTAPGAVLAWGGAVPLLSGRPPVDGRPTAYVCRRFTCDAPTTDPQQLGNTLGARSVTV